MAARTQSASAVAPSASFVLVKPCSSPRSRFPGGGTTLTDRAADAKWAAGSRLDRLVGAPGERDPLVGAPPGVLAAHGRARLLVQHRAAHLGDLVGAELLHELERLARVRDVVGDEDARRLEVDELGNGRQDHRHVEPLVDTRVELHVHRERVLDAQRVADRAGDEQPAACDAEDQVGLVAVGGHRLRERTRADAELVPRHHLALAHRRASVASAAVSTSTARSTSSALDSSSGWWLMPPFRLRTNSIAVGTPAAARIIASCPAPDTSSGAPGAAARSAASGGSEKSTGSNRTVGS